MATDDSEQDSLSVRAPSGATYTVLNEAEAAYFEDHRDRYLSDNHFTNMSDLQEVDRVLVMEMMCWRWSNWITAGYDYFGTVIDDQALQKQIKEYSSELRLIKKALGIDKTSRDKDKGDSIAEYIENIRRRAKEFGYHREEQLTKALILFNELSALITLHDNCDERERKENHVTQMDVMQWIRDTAIPEYEAIDAHFRQTKQRLWIRSL